MRRSPAQINKESEGNSFNMDYESQILFLRQEVLDLKEEIEKIKRQKLTDMRVVNQEIEGLKTKIKYMAKPDKKESK